VLNQSLVEVEWHPPPTANGAIQKYWVQYKHKNESASATQDKPSIAGNTSVSSSDISGNTKPNYYSFNRLVSA